MKHAMEPINILLIGYTEKFSSFLRDGLKSDDIRIYQDNNGALSDTVRAEPDCILTGLQADGDSFSHHIHSLREQYPDAAIITCVGPDSRSYPKANLHLVDGYIHIDPDSPVWAENLEILITKVIENFRNKGRTRKSHDRIYRRIFEDNPIPMALSDPATGVFIEVNQSFLTTSGYTRDEVIGKSSRDLQVFEDQEIRNSLVAKIDKNAPPRDKEVVFRTKEGRLITGLFSVDKLNRGNREVILTTMKDISHLKEVESTLSARNRCIHEILSSVSEGIIVYDLDLRYRVWNQYMEHLTGISEREILGKPARNFFQIQKGDDLPSLVEQTLQGKKSTSQDIWYKIPETGKSGWVSINYTPFRNSSGNITGLTASIRDISDRKQAEDEIRSHKGLLRSIIDTVPVSIICFDEDGKILLANTNFSASFGLRPDTIEGHTYEDFCQDSRFERHVPLIHQALQGREVPFHEEMELPGEKPGKRYLRGRYSPLRGTDGCINGVVAVIIDITDIKSAHASVELVNAKLNLLSSITRHDILNSLTGVLGYLTYAEEEQDLDKMMEYIRKSHQVALLIQEQIEFTRDYQDLGVKEPLWQNSRSVFLSAVSSLKIGDINVNLALDEFYIYADPLLERVIFNLVDNALRYGGKITRITSYWYKKGDEAVWVIRDDGVGIPDSMKERIFRKGVGKNTGLGLFLTREILDITGLSISETGVEGEGAVFEIRVPEGVWEER